MSMGFRGICSVPSAIPRPIDNASRPASLLRDILSRSPTRISPPVPRFRQSRDTAKIQPVKGLRVEILRQQNTTRPLTGWIGVAA
ncbi:hypothetical protein QIH01_08510 [Brevibacillus brevis]|uniref:hypothetical protein n=1 Tax=Brevibacillus brevis TaxID=1393 RepID=UPI00279B4895|nr:hypothetical protein QIH01_08510 [Brevibacillus brevis]